MGGGNFYIEVMKELIVAFGAALVIGNVLAIVRRRPPEPTEPNQSTGPDQSTGPTGSTGAPTLTRAPLGRSLVFVALGTLMVVWGLASLAG